MDIIRQILCDAEEHDFSKNPLFLNDPYYAYQVWLMNDAGIIEARIQEDGNGVPQQAVILGMTWAGHDFLDAVREDTIWNKVKQNVIKPGASWTFSLIVEYAKQEIRKRVLGHSGGQ